MSYGHFRLSAFPSCRTDEPIMESGRFSGCPSFLGSFLFAAGLFCAVMGNAAEIAWDKVTLDTSARPTIEWRSSDNHYWLYLGLSYARDSGNWTVASELSIPEFYGFVYEANLGDIVGGETSAPSTVFAENIPWRIDSRPSASVSRRDDEVAYFAIVLYDNDAVDDTTARPIYGWFALKEDEALTLVASAIDLGGDAILVGGGSLPTPEPTGGMLLLLGAAALVLRRKTV